MKKEKGKRASRRCSMAALLCSSSSQSSMPLARKPPRASPLLASGPLGTPAWPSEGICDTALLRPCVSQSTGEKEGDKCRFSFSWLSVEERGRRVSESARKITKFFFPVFAAVAPLSHQKIDSISRTFPAAPTENGLLHRSAGFWICRQSEREQGSAPPSAHSRCRARASFAAAAPGAASASPAEEDRRRRRRPRRRRRRRRRRWLLALLDPCLLLRPRP